jgi:Domain of unknown function (DUF4124)
MRTLLFTLMSIACATAAAGSVYKWVDENGVVHYSDQPHENAQKVELKAPQTYSAPKAPPTGPAQPIHNPVPKTGPAYQSCSISEPTSEQVYMNTSTVTAGVTVQPAVRPGDTAVVTLDGQRVPGVPAAGGQFEISPVDRGAHSIQMTVQDSTGTTVCSSAAVTFYVRQPSLQSPTQPVRPH